MKKNSLAIKKLFPKYYNFQKKIFNKIPMIVSLWDKKKYLMNFGIYKMLNVWKENESEMLEADIVYKSYNSGDFIDVGAFNGFYSFLLSPKANKNDNFICCEPDHNAHINLFDNLKVLKNNYKNINYSIITTPINNGRQVIKSDTGWGHPCFLDASNNSDSTLSQKKISSTSIDKLVNSLSLKPSFIKIDTEGAENDVIEGMIETLKNFKPKIMLEKHPTMIPENAKLAEIDKILSRYNYNSTVISKSNLAIRELWQ